MIWLKDHFRVPLTSTDILDPDVLDVVTCFWHSDLFHTISTSPLLKYTYKGTSRSSWQNGIKDKSTLVQKVWKYSYVFLNLLVIPHMHRFRSFCTKINLRFFPWSFWKFSHLGNLWTWSSCLVNSFSVIETKIRKRMGVFLKSAWNFTLTRNYWNTVFDPLEKLCDRQYECPKKRKSAWMISEIEQLGCQVEIWEKVADLVWKILLEMRNWEARI